MARDERRSNTSAHMPDSQLGLTSTKISYKFQSHCDEIDEKRQGIVKSDSHSPQVVLLASMQAQV